MQKLTKESKIKLKNGVLMPIIGLGTYKLTEGGEVEMAVKNALESGYTMIDTASVYENEKGVRKGIENVGFLREEVFITTKLWNIDQGYDSALKAIDESLEKLGVSYVDLYLIHWPTAANIREKKTMINKREETWRAMEKIYQEGKARAIGVANYTLEHLKEMDNYANILPMVNQIEFHPFLYQKELMHYCRLHDIAIEAYASLTRGEKMEDDRIVNIAKKHNKTIAQVLLRWGLQKGVIVIPRSSKKEHIIENISVFDFELDLMDMDILDNLNENLHLYPDPAQFV